jgi:MbtH protein
MDQDQHLNPFDNEEGNFFVLKNAKDQYSLWPEFADIPNGWKTVLGPSIRNDCVSYIEKNWSSINPFDKANAHG